MTKKQEVLLEEIQEHYDEIGRLLNQLRGNAQEKKADDADARKVTVKNPNEMESVIAKYLQMVSMPTNVLGYMYLKLAIMMALENPTTKIARDMYPAIAKEFDTTPPRVEHAMRHAIKISFANCNKKRLKKMFGDLISSEKQAVTNGKFVATIAEKIRLSM